MLPHQLSLDLERQEAAAKKGGLFAGGRVEETLAIPQIVLRKNVGIIMFEHFDYADRSMIYEALLHLVKSNSGFGFQNYDQGHPAYRMGRDGEFDLALWGDSPGHNRLFKLMHELSVALNEAEERKPTITEYMFSWSDFCRIATDAYDAETRTSYDSAAL